MNRILDANLRALAIRHAALAEAVRAAPADPDLAFVASASGLPVPVRRGGAALHSRVDPVREARRLAAALPPTGVAVFLGLGGGYLPAALLDAGGLFAGVIVERDASALRALLGGADLAGLLADPRIAVVTDPSTVTAAVLAAWAPGLMGDLRTVPLRPWCDLSRPFFDRAAAAVEAARDHAAADWAAQARFGKRWFANALANLPPAERARLSIDPVGSALVVGAGPSLDRFAARLPDERRGRLLVATDTSLPALLERGIVPDLVVSIDCQAWGYRHLMHGMPSGLPLLLDLSSPPLLARSRADVGFFASAHPLARWLSRHWRRLPEVDASGGNVAHAAVSLADALGAREIRLVGVDFSYPLGSAYARGTWLHRHFQTRADRFSPSEGSFYGMLVADPRTLREDCADGPRYTPPLMRDYRRSFENLVGTLEAAVRDEWCLGPPLRVARGTGGTAARWSDGFRMGAAATGWRSALGAYAALLARLPEPRRPLASWWHGLDRDLREAWQTLLPLVPGLAGDPSGDRCALLERARRWALSRISALVPVHDGSVPHE